MKAEKPSVMKTVTDQTFDETVLTHPKLVVVDFWAESCVPCHALTATLESVLQENPGKAAGFRVDVDGNQEIAARYGIRGVPTTILFRHGKEVARIVGNKARTVFEAALATHGGG